MTRKQHTIYGAIGLVIGIFGGAVGTAFSMGAEKQLLKDTLIRHTTELATIKLDDEAHEKATQQELDRFAEIIAGQMTQLQLSISQLTTTVGDLRTDVSVLKALMERMENDLKTRVSSG